MRYQLITYDVWGNERDGYEVNQAFTTNTFYSIGEGYTDEEIIHTLKVQGCFKKYLRKACIEIEGDKQTVYVSYRGRPEFELRKVD